MGDEMLVLGRDELDGLGVTWTEIVDALEDAFRQKAAGLVQNPPKPAVHPRPDSFINAMPAYLGGSDRVGIKWVAGYESNRQKRLPYIFGVFLLTDADTGRPLAVIDGGWITEMRTAGVTGVVLRLVKPAQRTLAMVGCGVQAHRHLEMILSERPEIEEIRAFDRFPEAANALLTGAGERRTAIAESAEDALAGADVVVTAVTMTASGGGWLSAEQTGEDALLLPLDYDDAMAPAAASAASLFVVDDLGQYRSIRDLEHHFSDFREPDGELAQVVAGEIAVPDRGRRIFMNLGIAMDDVALGALVYDRARERSVGRTIAFP